MTRHRFEEIARALSALDIAVLGDFCLDRYLEIDPARREVSIETGLEVYNVVNVRSQPGAAGTILNNLVALGISHLFPIGFCGHDGEGFELLAALKSMRGVDPAHFHQMPGRRTFTYCKPLIVEATKPPRELNRFDSKNWTPTPQAVSEHIAAAIEATSSVSALIIMDQVDVPETGVVTRQVLKAIQRRATANPQSVMIADSRRGLTNYPPVCLKMNERELATLTGTEFKTMEQIKSAAVALAHRQGRPIFVTLAEHGIVGAEPGGVVEYVPAFLVRGHIDVVGAGDAVTANLAAALAAGASLREALELAMAAASIVVHKLGTTGTASMAEIRALLFRES